MKKNKILALLLSVLMLCILFSGCSKSKLHIQKGNITPSSREAFAQNTGIKSEKAETEQGAEEILVGKESSYEALLNTGDVGICALYEPSVDSLQKVNIKVLSYIRGAEAKQVVEDYTASNKSISIGELPSKAIEYAVVEYKISLSTDYQMIGKSFPIMKMCIKGTNGEALEYDNAIYTMLSSFEITNPEKITQEEVLTLKSIFAVPVGCTDYVLEFGAENGLKALFKGE